MKLKLIESWIAKDFEEQVNQFMDTVKVQQTQFTLKLLDDPDKLRYLYSAMITYIE